MKHGINDWEETRELAPSTYCACGAPFYAVKYRWKGETELRCSATCLMLAALQEELVCDDDERPTHV